MSHPELCEKNERLEIRSPMRPGMRVLLAILALFPLLAPYELIVRVEWETYLHPFFLLAAFISLGAIALCAFLLFAAVAGLSSRMVFDRSAGTFVYSSHAPIVRPSPREYPLDAIDGVEVRERDWSDSAPTYHLGVLMTDGTVFESGSSWSRGEIESIEIRVRQFLADAIGCLERSAPAKAPGSWPVRSQGERQVLDIKSARALERPVPFAVSDPCPACEGQGRIDERPCPACHATGVQRLYHGTKADLKPGELIEPGRRANLGEAGRIANYVYMTGTLDAATWGPELAQGDSRGRIYIVEPTGPVEDDPNLTDKRYPGNPTKSYRSREPLRVTGEIADWQGHSPEEIKAMKDGLELLEREGAMLIDD